MEEAETEETTEDVVGKTLGEASGSVDAPSESSIPGHAVVEPTTGAVRTAAVPASASAGSSVPMFSLAPPAEDSSESADEDLLPSMSGGFGYWSQMLNVTKVAEPLPPLTAAAKASAVRPPRPSRQSGGDHYDTRRGGPRGGKGGWKGRPPLSDNVGSFVSWAKDPSASDGRQRSSSRSPRRNQGESNIESFMSWAREDDDDIAPKEEPHDEGAGELGSFLAWASAEGGGGDSVKTEEVRENGEDALMEKEERRLAAADEGSEDEAASKRCRGAASLSLPKAENVEAEIAGLKKEIAAEEKSLEVAMAEVQAPGVTKAEKDESDEEIDLAAMQRWRRLEDELSDDGNEVLVKAETSNMSEAVASA